MAAIIEARDLVKRLDGFTAVDRISFAVPEGVILGFLGPNGAGNVRGDHKPPSLGLSAVSASWDRMAACLAAR